MKQKKHNRFLAAFLAVAMMFQMLPMLAFAADETAPEAPKVKIGETEYETLEKAVEAATSGDTITLGAGNYTLYGVTSEGHTKGKNLTFVGQGTEKTAWNIGAEVPDPANFGTEYNGDYSFDGAGTVTFKNMTLRSGYVDYLGFIRADKTVVEDCVINGETCYWGYTSAEFKNTTFNPGGRYALWTYSSPEMTFDGCTFNANGKVINVYTDAGAGKHNITVNFNNCTVNSSSLFGLYKQALNINDSNMGSYKYILNISNSKVTAERDNTTCTQLFGFGGKAKTNNTGRTDVNIDGKLVWSDGKMQTHDYTDGEKEQNFKRDEGDWTDKGDHYEREVTKTCRYCGYTTPPITEKGYKLEYDLNGGDPAEGADDETYKEKIVPENEKVELAPAPTMPGHFFHYWDGTEGNFYGDPATIKMTANTKLTAQWGEEPPEVPDTPEGPGCCGEVTAVIIAAGTTVVGYYAGTELFRNCYGLPYWPRNRSELALMLWEDADRPMPESTLLYPDIGQEEKDMDLQHAARWAMENELIPDLNWDSRKPEEEQKFFPTYAVSRARALHAWNKAQQLKQDA